ncbi:MAG TPA: DinB family protein [Vicinamibacterales bacterium]|nr:DinB family protein [Vicinamibacterales bacterium]
MHPQLTRLVGDYDAAHARLHAVAGRLTPGEAADRRDSGRWSVAENVAHLNLTSAAFLPALENGLEEASRLGGDARTRYRRDAMGWLFTMIVGPQPRIGRLRLGSVKTPRPFVPDGGARIDELLAEFDRLQSALVDLITASDERPIDQVYVESPFSRRVRYNMFSAFLMIPRHQLRHIHQCEWLWADPPR